MSDVACDRTVLDRWGRINFAADSTSVGSAIIQYSTGNNRRTPAIIENPSARMSTVCRDQAIGDNQVGTGAVYPAAELSKSQSAIPRDRTVAYSHVRRIVAENPCTQIGMVVCNYTVCDSLRRIAAVYPAAMSIGCIRRDRTIRDRRG